MKYKKKPTRYKKKPISKKTFQRIAAEYWDY